MPVVLSMSEMGSPKLAVVFALCLIACSKASDERAKPATEAPAIASKNTRTAPGLRCEPGIKPLPDRIQRGMCVAHNYQVSGSKGYGSKTSAATLKELKELGVQWVSLTPFGFMERLDEPKVHPIGNYRAGETDERMRLEIRQAKKAGLHVVLKPHLWIVDGKWRGEIGFDDERAWSQWFDSYEKWMLRYADLAQAEGVDILVVGVELRSMESKLEGRWRRLIRKARRRFEGKVTYSANWDDAPSLPWWDALDYIGIQFYPSLASSPRTDVSVIRSRIDEQLDALGVVSKARGKPVLITEVGYRSSPDALIEPHAWPERAGKIRVDHQTQTEGYRALIESIRDRPWVAGIYWWKWFTDPATTEEGPAGFSPRGKPAEAILRSAYGGNCTAPDATP